MAAQNELTESWLASVPSREEIGSRLTRWRDYPGLGVPFERGGRPPRNADRLAFLNAALGMAPWDGIPPRRGKNGRP